VRVLVTGSSGFVGRATVVALEARGDEVVRLDFADGDDIRDKQVAFWKVSDADIVLHLAAVARFADADADPVLAHEVNVLGTMHVAHAAALLARPLVYASTGSVYMPLAEEPPITEDFPVSGNSVYGVTKRLGEAYVERAGRWITLRYAHLYGPGKVGHGLVGGVLARAAAGERPRVMGGDQTNDFTYIDDVVAANLAALDAPFDAWGRAYNVGTGEETSAADAALEILDVFGYDSELEVVPRRAVDPSRFAYDVSRAEKLLGFRAAYTFRRGLEAMRDSA